MTAKDWQEILDQNGLNDVLVDASYNEDYSHSIDLTVTEIRQIAKLLKDFYELKKLAIDADSLLTLFAFSEHIFNKKKDERKKEAERIGFGLRRIYDK